MSRSLNSAIAVIGIDIGKNSFHVVGLDDRGAIVLRQKWSREPPKSPGCLRRFLKAPPSPPETVDHRRQSICVCD